MLCGYVGRNGFLGLNWNIKLFSFAWKLSIKQCLGLTNLQFSSVILPVSHTFGILPSSVRIICVLHRLTSVLAFGTQSLFAKFLMSVCLTETFVVACIQRFISFYFVGPRCSYEDEYIVSLNKAEYSFTE